MREQGGPDRRPDQRRGSKALYGLLIASIAIVATPAPAQSSCPPFDPRQSVWDPLTSLVKLQSWLKEHSPVQGPLSGAELLDFHRRGLLTIPPVTVGPPRGPTPLAVNIVWWWHPIDHPARIEFDADGDGNPEIVNTGYMPETYTYTQPGQFRATVRVHDGRGQIVTQVTTVTALSLSAFDAELRGRWTTMRAALVRGDIAAALDCIRSRNRESGREALRAVSRGGPANVNQTLSDITWVETRGLSAIYHMQRPDGVSEVRFSMDDDGVWRIEQF